jgi:hypothetical protein
VRRSIGDAAAARVPERSAAGSDQVSFAELAPQPPRRHVRAAATGKATPAASVRAGGNAKTVATLPAVKFRLFALAAIGAAALVQGGTGSARPQTTAPPPVVDIKVTITDRAITMRPKKAFRGDYARFILVNLGSKPHTFSFGAKKRGTGVQTGFVKPLKPKEQKILLLFLDYRGPVAYSSILAADRAKAAMRGVFTIG